MGIKKMERIPEGLRAIKKKLELAKKEKLTVADGEYVDEALKRCCEVHLRCRYRKECDKLNNKLSAYLPYSPRKIPRPIINGSDGGSWIPQLHLKDRELISLPVYRD